MKTITSGYVHRHVPANEGTGQHSTQELELEADFDLNLIPSAELLRSANGRRSYRGASLAQLAVHRPVDGM